MELVLHEASCHTDLLQGQTKDTPEPEIWYLPLLAPEALKTAGCHLGTHLGLPFCVSTFLCLPIKAHLSCLPPFVQSPDF